MSIKFKTSFLFKYRNSLKKSNNEHLSNSESSTKNTFIENEEEDELRGTKRKQDLYEDTDKTSSSFESEFDEQDSLPDSPEFTKQINISPPLENEALRQRQENIKARDAYLASFMNDPQFAEAVQNVGLFKENDHTTNNSSKRKSIKQRKTSDENFRTSCQIPLESRKSLRLQSKSPQFSYRDLPDDATFASIRKRKNYDSDDDLDNLEEIVYKPKIKSKSTQRHSEKISFLSVEDVTDSMINNIARKVVEKKYCKDTGTSCHQCRQKTTDTKTFCRSQDCGGVRGQFCGVCLLNRYGEDAAVALKDPNWHCPVCRGICNCSFCRAGEGKRPTGILVHHAFKAGYKSVKEFLDSLKGEGDYVNTFDDPKKLLGFTKDLQYAQMGRGRKEFLGKSVDLTKFKEAIELFKNKLFENNGENKSGGCTEPTQDPEVLLGFTTDLNYAVMGDNCKSFIGSHTLSYEH